MQFLFRGNIFFFWLNSLPYTRASSFTRFLDHTQRRTTIGWTPPDEWSARRRVVYLTTHNNHNRQISLPPVGFEHTISAGEWPQTYSLQGAATGTGIQKSLPVINITQPEVRFSGFREVWMFRAKRLGTWRTSTISAQRLSYMLKNAIVFVLAARWSASPFW